MLKKGNKIYSIISGHCPKCHHESMYVKRNPFNIANTLTMHENCSNCNLRYKLEPSFFYGSMYVSYAVGIAFAVAAFVILKLVLNSSLEITYLGIILTIVGFLPVILRLSRNLWINMFVKFDSKYL